MSHWISKILNTAATSTPMLLDKAKSNCNLHLLVPACFSPDSAPNDWRRLIEAATLVPTTVIFNPANGSGKALDTHYAAAISEFREAGGRAVGYLWTDHETRDLDDLRTDIDQYLKWYAIDGLFFDDVTALASPETIAYYNDITSYALAQDPDLQIIGNPGIPPGEDFVSLFDCLVLFEGVAHTLRFQPNPVYSGAYPAEQFAMLVNDAASAVMTELVGEAAERNFGYLYITDRITTEAPWAGLPSYWEAEIAAIHALRCSPTEQLMTQAGRPDKIVVKAKRWNPEPETDSRTIIAAGLLMAAHNPSGRAASECLPTK